MRAAEQGARIVVFPEMMLTGYPVEDLALRKSFVDASIGAMHRLAHDLATEGLDGVAVVIGYLDRRAGAAAARRRAGRRTARCGRRPARRLGRDHLGQASPAELRRVRRVPLLPARQYAAGVPADHPRRRAGRRRGRDLRGPVAGRRSGRRDPAGRGEPARRAERLALRAQQGRRPAGAVPAPGARGRDRARLRQHGRRSGRARLRRRLDHRGPGRRSCWPAARSSRRRWSSPTWTWPPPIPACPPGGSVPTRPTARR